jgi:hypothetical protein
VAILQDDEVNTLEASSSQRTAATGKDLIFFFFLNLNSCAVQYR